MLQAQKDNAGWRRGEKHLLPVGCLQASFQRHWVVPLAGFPGQGRIMQAMTLLGSAGQG